MDEGEDIREENIGKCACREYNNDRNYDAKE